MITGTISVVIRKDFFFTLVVYSREITVLIILKFIRLALLYKSNENVVHPGDEFAERADGYAAGKNSGQGFVGANFKVEFGGMDTCIQSV